MDDDAPRAGAPLAGSSYGTEYNCACGQIQIGAGRHDDGVIAT
jgi:hypothetical protein